MALSRHDTRNLDRVEKGESAGRAGHELDRVRPERTESTLARLPAFPLWLFLLFFASILTLLPCAGIDAHAAQVKLSWTASTSSTVTGYNLYYGTSSGNYSYYVKAGNVTSYTLTGLSEGATYYFAVAGYNGSGNQSGYSNEVGYTVPAACACTISPASVSVAGSGATGRVTVTAQSGCTWTASSAASWMTITSSASGTGSGTVSYSVAANTTTSSRTAASMIAGRSFTVTQVGSTFYTITASAGAGGAISPSGSVSVKPGSSRAFSISPARGYKVSGVAVDGVSVGAVVSYTFKRVSANHTIRVTFSRRW
jgi:hypothetical protein